MANTSKSPDGSGPKNDVWICYQISAFCKGGELSPESDKDSTVRDWVVGPLGVEHAAWPAEVTKAESASLEGLEFPGPVAG